MRLFATVFTIIVLAVTIINSRTNSRGASLVTPKTVTIDYGSFCRQCYRWSERNSVTALRTVPTSLLMRSAASRRASRALLFFLATKLS